MAQRPHIRRCRRIDFPGVMRLLAAAGVPLPPPDRATLRRFRRLVADLGSDLYLAMIDDEAAGLLHVTYARQLVRPPVARIELMLVAPAVRRQGIGTALLSFADHRARRRGCGALRWALAPDDRPTHRFAERAALLHTEETAVRHLRENGDDGAPE